MLIVVGVTAVCLQGCDPTPARSTVAPDAEIDALIYLPDSSPLPDVFRQDGHVVDPMVDVHVVITADNAYGFGYGDEASMANYFGGIENNTAGEIFLCSNGPESYTVPAADANAGKFLYIVAYADSAVTQGVIGQFKRDTEQSPAVYTGQGEWEVCATGQNYSPGSGGPAIQVINEQIALCNSASTDPGTTSVGWVDIDGNSASGNGVGALAVGEDNTTDRTTPTPGNEFPIVCSSNTNENGIDDEARWMWYNWDPANIQWPTQSPFMWPGGTNPDKQFLIFRLRAEDIPIVR